MSKFYQKKRHLTNRLHGSTRNFIVGVLCKYWAQAFYILERFSKAFETTLTRLLHKQTPAEVKHFPLRQ